MGEICFPTLFSYVNGRGKTVVLCDGVGIVVIKEMLDICRVSREARENCTCVMEMWSNNVVFSDGSLRYSVILLMGL